MKTVVYFFIFIVAFGPVSVCAQNVQQEPAPKEQPPFKLLRENEDYSYLRSKSGYKKDFWDPVKYISIDSASNSHLSFGGEFRPRYVFFNNERWGAIKDDKAGYYSERLALYADVVLGKAFRVFGEIHHGLTTGINRPIPAQDDELDLHQAFLDVRFAGSQQENKLTLRLGRQEMYYGISRLMGNRNTPNIRLSFDAVRAMYQFKNYQADAFFGYEVKTLPYSFDNHYHSNDQVWGTYFIHSKAQNTRSDELYYLGAHYNASAYYEGKGKEDRHTIGIRKSGRLGNSFYFNSELTYQFGRLDAKTIDAYAAEFDYHYRHKLLSILKEVGIKLDYASGDKKKGDNKLQTFNPMYDNPSYFGLLRAMVPMNLIDIQPSLVFPLFKKTDLTAECAFFWRATSSDGLYSASPPRVLQRDGQNTNENFIGTQPSLSFAYHYSRHLEINVESSCFYTGSFLEQTGPSNNIFYLISTWSYKF